ncbi:TetR/AcrR family transcriptional regulator [Croceicoccus mobilis]|nr:TetR/AcrR family transcriptional regulator [Croceicoccus mobilis]
MDSTGASGNLQKGAKTRASILDAAERLFSHRGYDGTSLRDLAGEADVRLGALHYHFGAKDQVLAAAIDRRLGTLHDEIEASFAAARAGNRLSDVQDCVRAFIMPFLVINADRSHPLHHFVVMTSHLMSSYRVPEVEPAIRRLSAITQIFITALCDIRADVDTDRLLTGTYLIEAALIFMMQDPGFLDDLSEHHHSAEHLDRIADASLAFFSAGLSALIDR